MSFSSSSINRVFLLGLVNKEPNWQFIEGKRSLCFQLVTVEKVGRSDKMQEHSEYHNIILPFSLVNTALNFKKGDMVFVQGKVGARMIYENGVRLFRAEILASSIELPQQMSSQYITAKL